MRSASALGHGAALLHHRPLAFHAFSFGHCELLHGFYLGEVSGWRHRMGAYWKANAAQIRHLKSESSILAVV